MIQIQCPACQKIQPEADLMIDAALKQRCNFCGVQFEVNITQNAFLGTEKISGKIVSKGLLDHESQEDLAFRVEPKIRMIFAMLIFLFGFVTVFIFRGGPFHNGILILLTLVCISAGVFAGMLAGRLGYSEVLTPGGAGVLAGLALAGMFALQAQGDMQTIFRSAFPIFGVYSVGSFFGGLLAWILRKFFDVKLRDR